VEFYKDAAATLLNTLKYICIHLDTRAKNVFEMKSGIGKVVNIGGDLGLTGNYSPGASRRKLN
jgi:hypothetical protein